MNVLFGSLLAVGYIVLYWLLGALLPKRFQSHSLPVMCVTGFLMYYSLFQMIALPLKVTRQSLKMLSVIWSAVLAVCVLFVLIRRHDVLLDSLREVFTSRKKLVYLTCLAVLTVGIGVLLGYNTNIISDYDAAYYIGLPVSSVYSNTLELMSPYTGEMIENPQHFYILNTDTLHSAYIYQVFNIHPLVERKWSFTLAMTVIFQMGMYLLGRTLFQEDRRKTGFFLVLSNLVLFYSYSIAGVSHYFAYRTYEGKAITAYLYTTLIFAFCLAIYNKSEKPWPWAALLLCAIGGVSFCNTALFVIPMMTGGVLLPYVIRELLHRNWRALRNMVLVLLPAVMWLGIYMII